MKRYLSILLALVMACPAWAIERNVASQKLTVVAIDSATGRPKTGDAANITAYVSKDDGAVTVMADTSATETDATNAKGVYIFDLAQGETDAKKAVYTAKSTTSGIDIIPQIYYPTPANFSLASIDSNGRYDIIKIAGTTQTARDLGTSVLLSSGTGTGQVSLSSGTVTVGTNNDKSGYSLSVTPPTSAQIATTVWQDATAGDFTTASSIGKSLYTTGAVPGAAGGHFIAGTNAQTTITGGLGADSIRAASIQDNTLTANKIATDAIGGSELATTAVAEINDGSHEMFLSTTVTSVTDQTTFVVGGTLSSSMEGLPVFFHDVSAGGAYSKRNVVAVDTGTNTIIVDSDPDFTVVAGDLVKIHFGPFSADVTGGGGGPSAATIADAVWDELRSGHTTSGTFGQGVLLISGTGTGQLDFTSGVVKANPVQWNGTAVATPLTAGIPEINVKNINNISGSGIVTVGANIGTAQLVNFTGTSFSALVKVDSSLVADAVWDEVQSGHTTAGTFGKYLDAQVSTVGGGSLTTSNIADAVWDELLAGHVIAGSAGAGLSAAQSAGDPWSTALPGGYAAGTAGKIIGDIPSMEVVVDGDSLAAIGQAVGGAASGGPIEQRKVAASRLLLVKSRSDGTFGVNGKVRMSPNDTLLWGLECAGTQLPSGANLFGMSTPTIGGADAANMTTITFGVSDSKAKFEMHLDSGAEAGDVITLVIPVQLSATETINVNVSVTVGP